VGERRVQELTLMLIRFAYLAILWMFVLGAISVVRSDMFGARVDGAAASGRREKRAAQKEARKQKPARRARGAPTQVVVVDGPSAGEHASLDAVPLLIGRGPDAAIRLDDDYVSTRHARIGASGETFYVEDLGSTNGTYIGSQRLTQATAVQLGTRIRVGKTTLELKK
jgi:pSer/pThr/pTyr-binding forkhead associated (FHA) protein